MHLWSWSTTMSSETKKRRRKQGTNQASGPSKKRPLIAFTPAFKYGVLWMSAAFFLPMLLWTLFTLATLSGRIPVMRPNPGWAIGRLAGHNPDFVRHHALPRNRRNRKRPPRRRCRRTLPRGTQRLPAESGRSRDNGRKRLVPPVLFPFRPPAGATVGLPFPVHAVRPLFLRFQPPRICVLSRLKVDAR